MNQDIAIGNKYGKLTVISKAEPYKRRNPRTNRLSVRKQWLCKCECGNERIVSGTKLKRGEAIRCASCGYKTRPQSTAKLKPLERLYNLTIRGRAKKKNIEMRLTLAEFESLIAQDCHYCGSPPVLKPYVGSNSFKANGIDRIDSSSGYIVTNCVPCCKWCNVMKHTNSQLEFFDQIKRIYNYNHLQTRHGQ